jgi:pantothenate kinase
MALQKAIVTKDGFECPEGYLVINEIHYRKGDYALVDIHVFKDKAASLKSSGLLSVETIHTAFTCDVLSEVNILTQAYSELKTRVEFSGLIDV